MFPKIQPAEKPPALFARYDGQPIPESTTSKGANNDEAVKSIKDFQDKNNAVKLERDVSGRLPSDMPSMPDYQKELQVYRALDFAGAEKSHQSAVESFNQLGYDKNAVDRAMASIDKSFDSQAQTMSGNKPEASRDAAKPDQSQVKGSKPEASKSESDTKADKKTEKTESKASKDWGMER